MDDQTSEPAPVSRLDLLFLIRAHNRHEISLEEWMQLSRAWAEAMERQCGGCYTEDGTNESLRLNVNKKASA
jgi:hypothetical protein